MEKYITDERTGLKYELVGDYYLIAGEDEPEEDQPIGVWGQRHISAIAHLTAHRISTEHRKRILLPDDLNMARSFHFFSVKSAFDYCFFRYWVL